MLPPLYLLLFSLICLITLWHEATILCINTLCPDLMNHIELDLFIMSASFRTNCAKWLAVVGSLPYYLCQESVKPLILRCVHTDDHEIHSSLQAMVI
jgi:hypothetical protein